MVPSTLKILLYTICVAAVCLLVAPDGRAQEGEFSHGGAASYMYGLSPNGLVSGVAGTWIPQINITTIGLRYPKGTMSLTGYLSAAFSLTASSNPEANLSSFVYEGLGSLNFNFGHGSFKLNRSSVGGYFGLGWGYNSIAYADAFSRVSNATLGLAPVAGIKFKTGGGSSFHFGAYSIIGTNDITLIGLRIAMNFGIRVRK